MNKCGDCKHYRQLNTVKGVKQGYCDKERHYPSFRYPLSYACSNFEVEEVLGDE